MNIFSFRIVLENTLNPNEKQVMYYDSTSDYLTAWKEAAEKATEELKKHPKHWHIDIIQHLV